MEKSNRQIDITGDILHQLAIEANTTLREINKAVGDKVFDIVGEALKVEKNDKQGELLK